MKHIMMLVAIVFATSVATAQDKMTKDSDKVNFSKMDVSPLDVTLFRNEKKEPIARVMYSRPQMKDREIFGNLVPYGKVWRTGANEASEVTFYREMDVVRINVPVRTSPKPIESFSMAFKPVENGTHLMMGWDNTYVEIPFMSI